MVAILSQPQLLMAWYQTGDMPLPELTLTKIAWLDHSELTHWPLGDLNKILDK